MFSREVCDISKNTFLQNISARLLLTLVVLIGEVITDHFIIKDCNFQIIGARLFNCYQLPNQCVCAKNHKIKTKWLFVVNNENIPKGIFSLLTTKSHFVFLLFFLIWLSKLYFLDLRSQQNLSKVSLGTSIQVFFQLILNIA